MDLPVQPTGCNMKQTGLYTQVVHRHTVPPASHGAGAVGLCEASDSGARSSRVLLAPAFLQDLPY